MILTLQPTDHYGHDLYGLSTPDLICQLPYQFAQQLLRKHTTGKKTKKLNNIVKCLKQTNDIKLQYPKLDLESLRLLVFNDSSFHNREDSKSELGFLIFLADKSNRCSVLHYSSKKSHRVTRSSMEGETLAFVDEFDPAIIINHDLRRMLNSDIPVVMLMDSEAIFRILTRSRYTTQRGLEIDIASARESYNNKEISNIH